MTEKASSITFSLDPRSGVGHRIDNWSTKSATPWFWPLREGDQLPSLRDVVTQINDQSQHGGTARTENSST